MHLSLKSRIKYFFGKKDLRSYCLAYKQNLYFRIDGSVTPCSANFENVYGKYPDNTVKEILEGEKRQNLLNLFSKGIVPSGCVKCFEMLNDNNFYAAPFHNYSRDLKGRFLPVTAEFELSNHCNLKCIMCNSKYSDQHFDSNVLKIDEVYDTNFVNQLTPYLANFKRSSFKGGEPFLINLYYLIWEQMISSNSRNVISVTSNGTVLNARVKKILSRGRFDINISLDSLNKQNFENIRKNAVFESFISNLDYFILYSKENKTQFNTCVCVMRDNYKDIIEIFNYANTKGFNVYLNFVEDPIDLSLKSLPNEDLKEILQYFVASKPSFTFINGNTNSRVYDSIIHQLRYWENTNNKVKLENDFQLNSVDILKQQIAILNDEDLFLKVDTVSKYFEKSQNRVYLKDALNTYQYEELLKLISELNSDELIVLIENEIHNYKRRI